MINNRVVVITTGLSSQNELFNANSYTKHRNTPPNNAHEKRQRTRAGPAMYQPVVTDQPFRKSPSRSLSFDIGPLRATKEKDSSVLI